MPACACEAGWDHSSAVFVFALAQAICQLIWADIGVGAIGRTTLERTEGGAAAAGGESTASDAAGLAVAAATERYAIALEAGWRGSRPGVAKPGGAASRKEVSAETGCRALMAMEISRSTSPATGGAVAGACTSPLPNGRLTPTDGGTLAGASPAISAAAAAGFAAADGPWLTTVLVAMEEDPNEFARVASNDGVLAGRSTSAAATLARSGAAVAFGASAADVIAAGIRFAADGAPAFVATADRSGATALPDNHCVMAEALAPESFDEVPD